MHNVLRDKHFMFPPAFIYIMSLIFHMTFSQTLTETIAEGVRDPEAEMHRLQQHGGCEGVQARCEEETQRPLPG